MRKIRKSQKITIVVISTVIVAAICYYAYASKEGNNVENLDFTTNETQKDQTEENQGNTTEKSKGEMIKVHVSGAVQNEGLIELEENSRVADAIEKAGGFTENACAEEINLAYMLEDGMKIKIPTKEEAKNNNGSEEWIQMDFQNQEQSINSGESENASQIATTQNNKTVSQSNNAKSQSSKTASQMGKTTSQKININTATQAELVTLPGIGESTAAKIINYRKENGKFKNIEDIKKVSGIGDAKYGKIKNLITV